jgi:hypothetical protein
LEKGANGIVNFLGTEIPDTRQYFKGACSPPMFGCGDLIDQTILAASPYKGAGKLVVDLPIGGVAVINDLPDPGFGPQLSTTQSKVVNGSIIGLNITVTIPVTIYTLLLFPLIP